MVSGLFSPLMEAQAMLRSGPALPPASLGAPSDHPVSAPDHGPFLAHLASLSSHSLAHFFSGLQLQKCFLL
jgi:hypothetical protein